MSASMLRATLQHQRLAPALIALTLSLSGCSLQGTGSSSQLASDAQTNDQLQVVTTFLPLTNFTQAVAGDRAQVTQLLPANLTPHDYQAKPQDAQQLAQADVLIENGLEFESFLTDLVANADNNDLIIVDTSQGIEPLPEEEHSKEEEHHDDEHSDDEHHDKDGHSDEHGDEEHHDEDGHDTEEHSETAQSSHNHAHGDEDPHIWLDPKKAIQQVQNIRDALIQADPEGADTYTANAADYVSKLQALDQKITTALAPYTGQTFVTYHDFSAHFAHSYELEVEYLVNIPESNAAPADMQRVIEAAQASNLKTLLSEPQQQSSPFEAIAKDLGIQVSTFDSIETSGPEGLTPDYYLTTMEQNLENLETAFGKSTP